MVSGALDGIERVLAAHLRPGDRVAVENPGYAALFDLLRAHGCASSRSRVDDRGMRPEALEAALARGAARGGDHPARPEPDRRARSTPSAPASCGRARAATRGCS